MASASLRRRGLQRSHRRLRPRQDGGGNHRLPRPHHLPRRPPHPPQTRSRHQTHDRRTERHGAGTSLLLSFNRSIILPQNIQGLKSLVIKN